MQEPGSGGIRDPAAAFLMPAQAGFHKKYCHTPIMLRIIIGGVFKFVPKRQISWELKGAYGDTDRTIELVKDSDGNYYLIVPKGGGDGSVCGRFPRARQDCRAVMRRGCRIFRDYV